MFSRGKAEVSIFVDSLTEEDSKIRFNEPLARQYYDSLTKLKESFDLKEEVSLSLLASMPEVIKALPAADDEEVLEVITRAVSEACKRLDEMRMAEGGKLAEDLISRGRKIRSLTEEIEKRAPLVVSAYKEKMQDRIAELVNGQVAVPEERILLEAAIFADKCSITEELVRLDSHMIQLEKIITKSTQPDGKKLDFLVQEMNREANTIGSKSNDIEITGMMLEIKSEVEKIREQVQNIE